MTLSAKIANLMPEDFAVSGSPLSIGVAAYGGSDIRVHISVFSGTTLVAEGNPSQTIDYGMRIPADMYISRIQLNPGTYTVSMTAADGTGTAGETCKLVVYDPPAVTTLVTNQSQLNAALAAIKVASYTHARIILAAGNYQYPAGDSYDLSAVNKLVSLEAKTAGVWFQGGSLKIKWAYWYRVGFTNPTGAAFTPLSGSHHVLERCAIVSCVTGVQSSPDAFVKLEDCYLYATRTGIIAAKIVRGLTWTNVTNIVFQNVPVIESTTGHRGSITESPSAAEIAKSATWCLYDGPQYGILIRNNQNISDFAYTMRIEKSAVNMILVGNTSSTTGSSPIRLTSISSSWIAHNSFTHSGSGPTMVVSGNVQGNFVANNWFTSLDSSARRFADSGTWTNNASGSSLQIGTQSLVSVSPVFSNSYLFLGSNSPLRTAGITLPSVRTVHGIRTMGQIGALPSHPDTGLTSIYRNVLSDPLFSYAAPSVVVF